MNVFGSWRDTDVAAHNAKVAAQRLGAGSLKATPADVPTEDAAAARPLSWSIPGPPVPAPRMSQRDKWLKPPRPCVAAYWDYRDRIKRVTGRMDAPLGLSIVFYLPMPDSWSQAKRERMDGKPCRVKPDLKNLICGVEDAMFPNDSAIAVYPRMEKFWTIGKGSTAITIVPE